MHRAIIYIHGKDGSAEEAEHYKALFEGRDLIYLSCGETIHI